MIDYGSTSEKITVEDIRVLIADSEIDREEGNTDRAAEDLSLAMEYAQLLNRIDLYAQALAHRIICWKHLYQNGDKTALVWMEQDVEEGLALNISKTESAVFFLRKGDVLTEQKNYERGNWCYKQAWFKAERGTHTEVEYLGHFGESFVALGAPQRAMEILDKALTMMGKVKDIREWHRLIIVSGLLGRRGKAAMKARRFILGTKSLWASFKICKELKERYGKPQRYNQFLQNLPFGWAWFKLYGVQA